MAVKRYDGSQWVTVAGKGDQGTSSSIATWVKTATGGETSVSGNDDNSQPLSYTVGQELVFINGALQKRGSDYTATTGNSITGLTALAANDVVTVWTVNAFSVTGAIANSLVDAKGDLIVATGADTPGRLAVGSNNQVLTADSTTGTGLKWAAAGGGYTSLATGSLSGSSVAITSISGSYKNLQLVIRNYLPATDNAVLQIRVNQDSNANRHYVNQTIDTGAQAFSQTSWQVYYGQDNATSQSLVIVDLYDYANTTTWKVGRIDMVFNNPTTSTSLSYHRDFGVYNQTGAITSLELRLSTGNFTSGDYILLGA